MHHHQQWITLPVPDRPMHRTLPGVVINLCSWLVSRKLKFGMRIKKSRSHSQLSSFVHFSIMARLIFFYIIYYIRFNGLTMGPATLKASLEDSCSETHRIPVS